MALVSAGFGVGLVLGPLSAGILAGYVGFSAPFWVVGACTWAVAAAVALGVHEPRREKDA